MWALFSALRVHALTQRRWLVIITMLLGLVPVATDITLQVGKYTAAFHLKDVPLEHLSILTVAKSEFVISTDIVHHMI
ncbi:hypothetical protein WOLCODRAFT_29279 [Wolfiporia cocos MD-104 SS10]|uniref:Uncharacterized protein n=1 Tax=Wolfiporia cocos (strain MD-104) TaxID=742152 RepID=A0A2H3JAM6_WOLCO|nr:hypothetical protein WOLCODRAFT_29279 [Wolfiporia cocos MD-104 SS10]